MNGKVDSHDARLSVDKGSGLIRLHGAAFWSPVELESLLGLLARHVAATHARGQRANVLVDLTGAGPQLAETIGLVQARAGVIYRPDDRLGVVLGSSLLQRQVARIERAAEWQVFPTVAAAETWLRSAGPGG